MNSFGFFVILSMCYIHLISSNAIHSELPETEPVKSNILMSHVIFRHGDRNPIDFCPSDPWKDPKYWPGGFGQLTNIGKLQVFKLGEWLAKRYKPLFPNGYSVETVKVYTTDLDRTMMSGAACLAGLFPPTEQQIWNSNLLWQPIPINMFDKSIDTKIRNQFNKCKLRDKFDEEYMNSDEVKKFIKSYQGTIDYVTYKCGEPVNVFEAHDTLSIEILKNFTVPDWVTETIDDLKNLRLFDHKKVTATPQLARLKIGFLIKEIVDNFERKINGNENSTFVLYAGQDVTIENVLNALGLFDDEFVPYAGCLAIDLYEENDTHFIQLSYRKNDALRVLDIPECGTKCPLRDFIDKYQAILPQNDYDTECQNKQ